MFSFWTGVARNNRRINNEELEPRVSMPELNLLMKVFISFWYDRKTEFKKEGRGKKLLPFVCINTLNVVLVLCVSNAHNFL